VIIKNRQNTAMYLFNNQEITISKKINVFILRFWEVLIIESFLIIIVYADLNYLKSTMNALKF